VDRVCGIVAYKPGSFSKNFAWHGTGLAKLHGAVAAGFSSRLTPVRRDVFRASCGIDDPNLQLIPINFFLFNRGPSEASLLAVDELVFQAVEQPHSLLFDRLALFALHLSNVGSMPSGGTPWARDFVLKRLWSDGFWRRTELDPSRIDSFLKSALDARDEVRTKCRTNYRHLFKLAGYLDGTEPDIENRDAPWLSSAVILAWDRGILSGHLPEHPTAEQLTEFVREQRIYKLLGVPEAFADSLASSLAPTYIEHLGVGRFEQDVTPVGPTAATPVRRGSRTRARELEVIARDLNSSQVARTRREVEQQLRNAALAAALRRLYGSQCMFCDSRVFVSISPEQFYAEAAHIRPLGRPHNGPDHPENMLVLCPNCHIQFDSGTLAISLASKTEMRVTSPATNHPLEGRLVRTRKGHNVAAQYVDWHRNYWQTRRT
jgi:hypothetical protein